jgi:hypothetical protein
LPERTLLIAVDEWIGWMLPEQVEAPLHRENASRVCRLDPALTTAGVGIDITLDIDARARDIRDTGRPP